jgi:hypothetical protein
MVAASDIPSGMLSADAAAVASIKRHPPPLLTPSGFSDFMRAYLHPQPRAEETTPVAGVKTAQQGEPALEPGHDEDSGSEVEEEEEEEEEEETYGPELPARWHGGLHSEVLARSRQAFESRMAVLGLRDETGRVVARPAPAQPPVEEEDEEADGAAAESEVGRALAEAGLGRYIPKLVELGGFTALSQLPQSYPAPPIPHMGQAGEALGVLLHGRCCPACAGW